MNACLCSALIKTNLCVGVSDQGRFEEKKQNHWMVSDGH